MEKEQEKEKENDNYSDNYNDNDGGSTSGNNYNDSDSPLSTLNTDNSFEDTLNELKNTRNELEHYRKLYNDTFNKLKYSLADFDNFRKNVEKQNSLKMLSIKADMLSVVVDMREDFIRAIDTIKQKKIDNAIFEGLESILKNIDIIFRKRRH